MVIIQSLLCFSYIQFAIKKKSFLRWQDTVKMLAVKISARAHWIVSKGDNEEKKDKLEQQKSPLLQRQRFFLFWLLATENISFFIKILHGLSYTYLFLQYFVFALYFIAINPRLIIMYILDTYDKVYFSFQRVDC